MYIALGTALGLIVISPFVGRWRAKMWLKEKALSELTIKSVPKIA